MARIGIDARLTYYAQGGIAEYTRHLIRELAALETAHDFVILHSRKDPHSLAAAPNQQHVSCWTPAHHRLERLALAVELLPLRLDLLHSPDFIPPYGGRQRSVITIHDLAFLHYPAFLTPESRRYYNDQIDAAAARADHVIAVSEATRADVIDLLSVPPEKVSTIPEAASEVFTPAPESDVARLRERYALPEGYILFVGTIEPRKNIDGLLRAYARLIARLPDAPPLVIAGRQGWHYDQTLRLYADLGLGGSVRWTGPVPHDDLPALYSGASVFCLPSFYEGFGLPPLEAMACGTPVIVANRASLPEVVGDAGLLVDPDDPDSIAEELERVLSDSALATRLRQRGLEHAGKFSWSKAARQTLSIYEQTISQ